MAKEKGKTTTAKKARSLPRSVEKSIKFKSALFLCRYLYLLSAITSLYSLRLYLGLYSKFRYSPVIIPISWISMGKIVNRNPSPRANRYNGGFMKRKSFLSFLSSFSLPLRLSRRNLLVSHG